MVSRGAEAVGDEPPIDAVRHADVDAGVPVCCASRRTDRRKASPNGRIGCGHIRGKGRVPRASGQMGVGHNDMADVSGGPQIA